MACTDVDMNIHVEESQRGGHREPPLMRYYQASEVVPPAKGPLHNLLKKQPAVLGSLQMVSGLLSFGVGMLFAVTQQMSQSLFTLFRVSMLTGVLFICAGLVSNLLYRYPELVTASLVVNSGSILVSVAAACLISIDLARWDPDNDQHLRMEVLELCVLGFEIFLSIILCIWFSKEKFAKSP